MSAASDEESVGYKAPPRSTHYRKGQSGNPRGRPKGRHRQDPFERVLGQLVTIREDGVERRVTAAEAFLLQLTKRALEGDGVAARQALEAIWMAKDAGLVGHPETIQVLVLSFTTPIRALEQLKMARILDRRRPTARVKLEPWIVEAALARLGKRTLTREEQQTVLAATRTPGEVNWPDWWHARPQAG